MRCFQVNWRRHLQYRIWYIQRLSLIHISFVGSTGAGKTTITNLINSFYDIQEGKIRYDGINITKIEKDDLRRSLGIVFQDTHVFTGTIKENIRYGKLDTTDEEVYEAARLAHLWHPVYRSGCFL